jgi:hypothetical protein
MVKLVTGGGSDLSPDMQKIVAKLKQLLKGGKTLNIGIDELKKKAGVFNVKNATVSAYINRKKKAGEFKNLTIKRFGGGLDKEVGKSQYDPDYKNNKKFRDFYEETYNKTGKNPWSNAGATLKTNSYNAFLRNKDKLNVKGFILSETQMAEKLGVSPNTLRTYNTPSRQNLDSTTSDWIKDNIKKIRTIKDGKSVNLYKDLTQTELNKWTSLQDSPQISTKLVNNIKEYDKIFRDQIKDNKKLPDIGEVIQKTSMKTPSVIANTEALYSRLLRGEKFRRDVDIARDVVLGKNIINELSTNSSTNPRRTAFYQLALDNVNKAYPGQSGDLGKFKRNFRDQLKKELGLKKGQTVPFSINEVISLSAGESRGVQPFSVFVDAVETNINKNELKNYQGAFSKKLAKVQNLLSGSKPNKLEAENIALSLDSDRNTLVNRLTKKGFTKAQINQLNLPDIKVGTDVLETYKAEDLARYKKSGVDIEKFAKDKGYYIDAKKAKPYFDVSAQSFKNTLLKAARTNEGNVCQIFRAEGGRIGFAAGSSCVKQMEFAFDSDPVKLSQDINKLPYEEGPINKVKSVATKFLQSPMLRGAGKYGAIAAGGAVAAGFVKEFMNDDPTTYLSNEEQQKNLLIDMVTGSLDDTPEQSPAIGDAYLPALGATTVAGTAAVAPSTIEAARSGALGAKKSGITKTALKTLGRGLSATQTPLGLLATEPLYLAEQVQQGDSLGEIATNPFNYMGAAFAGPATEFATKGLNPTIAKTMRLGISPTVLKTVSRRFGLPGLALSMGISGYEMFDDYRNKRGMFSEE